MMSSDAHLYASTTSIRLAGYAARVERLDDIHVIASTWSQSDEITMDLNN